MTETRVVYVIQWQHVFSGPRWEYLIKEYKTEEEGSKALENLIAAELKLNYRLVKMTITSEIIR